MSSGWHVVSALCMSGLCIYLIFVRPRWHLIAHIQLLTAFFVHNAFCSISIHLLSFLLSKTSSKSQTWESYLNLISYTKVFISLKYIVSSNCLFIAMKFSFYKCSSFLMNNGEVLSWLHVSALWKIISAPCLIIFFLCSFLLYFSV